MPAAKTLTIILGAGTPYQSKYLPPAASAATRLAQVLMKVPLLHPSKSASDYWTGINGALLDALGDCDHLWTQEKTATFEGLALVKEESLTYLRAERNRLLALSHRQALAELIRLAGVDSRIAKVQRVTLGNLLAE